jgi:hypothetical protein
MKGTRYRQVGMGLPKSYRSVQKRPVAGSDFRPVEGIKHTLGNIFLLIIAMVCGVENIEDISFFGETHEAWLKKYPALPHGIPRADTILRVLGRIDHRKMEG